jgi:Clp amino terminal domain, pathogenicity island component
MADEPALDHLRRAVEARGPHASTLDALGAAVAVADEMRVAADELLDGYVGRCRAEGCSWAEIGEAFGISKQAAQQRFVAGPSGGPMTGLTDRARHVLVHAQKEARSLGHNYLGTEHLLLGLLRERAGLAARALGVLDVSADAVRAHVVEMIGRGDGVESGPIQFTPRSKKVLELAHRESKRLRHPCAGTEHMLLAIVAEGEGVAAKILAALGAGDERVYAEIGAMLSIDPTELAARARPRRLRLRRPG